MSKEHVAKYWSHQGYVRHCEYYLKHGDWVDDFYGEYQEKQENKWRTDESCECKEIKKTEITPKGSADYRGNNPIELTID